MLSKKAEWGDNYVSERCPSTLEVWHFYQTTLSDKVQSDADLLTPVQKCNLKRHFSWELYPELDEYGDNSLANNVQLHS